MELSPGGENVRSATRDHLPQELAPYFLTPTRTIALARQDGQMRLQIANHYNRQETERGAYDALVGLIAVAGIEAPDWGQNERDAAIAGATIIGRTQHADRMDPTAVFTEYTKTVKKLPVNTDYFGAPHSLFEMGEVVANAMGPASDIVASYNARLAVREAWSSYFGRIEDPQAKALAKELVEGLVAKVLPSTYDDEAKAWEWARKEPVMVPSTKELHDFYIQQTKQQGSFKRYAHEHTPEFQAALAADGFDMANFWNLVDPDQVAAGIATMAERPELAPLLQKLDEQLLAEHNIRVAEVLEDPALGKAYADQIQQSVTHLQAMNLARVHAPHQLYATIRDQAVGAIAARKPSRKLAPVRTFLQNFDLDLSSVSSAQEVVQFLDEPSNRQHILDTLERQNQSAQAKVRMLQDLFPGNPYSYLSLADRNESDLYEADKTRDCTAYHLENGFNAWTVPHWLANPGFNMAYISDRSTRVAKLGLLLARDEQQPRIVIDSIETYEDLKFPQDALVAIMLGIDELQVWATKNGFGDILFCTLTASSELSVELPVKKNPHPPAELHPYAGSSGLDEVWQSIPYTDDQKEAGIGIGYLQSEYRREEHDDDEPGVTIPDTDDDDEAQEARQEALTELEKFLSYTKNNAIFEQARKGDHRELIATYVAELLPIVHGIFGDNQELYASYSKHASFRQIITVQDREARVTHDFLEGFLTPKDALDKINQQPFDTLSGDSASDRQLEWIQENITVVDTSPFSNTIKVRNAKHEAGRLDEFTSRINKVARYMPIEQALALIFGEDYGADKDSMSKRNVRLRRDLPIIHVGQLVEYKEGLS